MGINFKYLRKISKLLNSNLDIIYKCGKHSNINDTITIINTYAEQYSDVIIKLNEKCELDSKNYRISIIKNRFGDNNDNILLSDIRFGVGSL